MLCKENRSGWLSLVEFQSKFIWADLANIWDDPYLSVMCYPTLGIPTLAMSEDKSEKKCQGIKKKQKKTKNKKKK